MANPLVGKNVESPSNPATVTVNTTNNMHTSALMVTTVDLRGLPTTNICRHCALTLSPL